MRKFFVSVLCFFCLALSAQAEETITRFQSDVKVNTDASIDVTESISVLSENDQIRHGIFRDFPTRYTSKSGVEVYIDLEVQSVTRDGDPENYVVQSIDYGKRIKIGDKDVLLNSGIHKYVIKYHANRLLGFFDGYDELYWNVVGNGWPFSVQSAYVKIHLPSGASIKQSAFYTGVHGSDGKDARTTASSGNEYAAQTTRVLQPHEDFTVAVAWQKGIVTPPTAGQQQLWMMRDNAGVIFMALTLLLAASYFFYAWNKVGRDPPKGTIIPLFHPPEGLGPAGVRYVWKQGYDNRAIAAALVGLAVKGRLKIDNSDGTYAIQRLANTGPALVISETALYNALPNDQFYLEQENHAQISSFIYAVALSLVREYKGALFVKNLGWFAIGLIISVGGLFISGQFLPQSVNPAIVATVAFLILAVGLLNLLFYYLMPAPTQPGRRILDAIEGFRMYMTTAEEKRLNMLNPPEKTPELFERYLPYAMALDCENAWNNKFAAVLAAAAVAGATAPLWYSSSSARGWDGLTEGIGAGLASTLSSSSTAPGSSSGSGGGGSSGGGGGGGGGGW
jgi:hypothetical protein